ncbi:3-hydroxyacyl-CoA dehydrogenase NAD-binding domain-containing protein [Fodinicola feengrottensis]|nr:3-hydroxyacyl-CoA dehydrogenase NAD-binding domain-containing protein [Fodinicola feengrottensis]
MELVGVVGAGVIGRGVCHAVAASGVDVVLVDVDARTLTDAVDEIRVNARMYRLLDGGAGTTTGSRELLQRIHPSVDYESLADADIVIENVPENWDIKQSVYQELSRTCPTATVFAANTSTIPITRIAATTDRPDQVVGLHFMNPVPLKPTVELIRGRDTSDSTVARVMELLDRMGKEAVGVRDSPGFVTNRVLMLAVNEATSLVEEGVAEPAAIDRLFTGGLGHRMGILATADLIGIDTVLNSIEMLYEAFGDSKYRPCPLLRKMVEEAGWVARAELVSSRTIRRPGADMPVDVSGIRDRVRVFVVDAAGLDGLADDERMFLRYHLSSLFAVQLVLFVERAFGIIVEDDDLDMENFATVNAIAALVARKPSAR